MKVHIKIAAGGIINKNNMSADTMSLCRTQLVQGEQMRMYSSQHQDYSWGKRFFTSTGEYSIG